MAEGRKKKSKRQTHVVDPNLEEELVLLGPRLDKVVLRQKPRVDGGGEAHGTDELGLALLALLDSLVVDMAADPNGVVESVSILLHVE